MPWCQVRVFVATFIGAILGNMIAGQMGWPRVFGVLIVGAAFWALGNYANATIFAPKPDRR